MPKKYGFIYKLGEDYALRMGNALYFLFDGINDIEEEVEIGNVNEGNLVDGYCLKLNKQKKKWQIVDTGHKCCKDIITSGKYGDGFEQSMEKFIKVFT